MKIKPLFILGLILCINFQSFSQEDDATKFQVGLNTGLFLTGDFSSIYNFNVGVEGQYFFEHASKFHHFFNGGFNTEFGTEGANLFAFDLGVGTQFDFARLWKKTLFLKISAGGLFWQERFSTQLIEGTIDTTISEFGFKANLGIGYQVSKRISAQLNLTQFSTKGTSSGLGVFYSF